jgi:hypothetical protein
MLLNLAGPKIEEGRGKKMGEGGDGEEKIENGKRDHAEEKQTSHQHVFTISQ